MHTCAPTDCVVLLLSVWLDSVDITITIRIQLSQPNCLVTSNSSEILSDITSRQIPSILYFTDNKNIIPLLEKKHNQIKHVQCSIFSQLQYVQ